MNSSNSVALIVILTPYVLYSLALVAIILMTRSTALLADILSTLGMIFIGLGLLVSTFRELAFPWKTG